MTRWPVSYPLALLIALITAAPIVVLIGLVENPADFLDTRNLDLLVNTLLLMLFTVTGAVIIGVPLAILTAYVRLPLGKLWLILLAAPLAMPSYIGAFTFYAAFGPGGEIDNLLGISTPSASGLTGATLVMILYTYPFVLLTTRASLLSQDASLINASRTLGLSLPMSRAHQCRE